MNAAFTEPHGSKQVIAAFVAASQEITGVIKNSKATVPTKTGGQYSYTYANRTDVLEAIKLPLAKHGLVMCQPPAYMEGGAAVRTILFHESGESLDFGLTFVPIDEKKRGDTQAQGSGYTYASRYAAVSIFCIPVDDDDGAAARMSIAEQLAEEKKSGIHQAAAQAAIEKFQRGDIAGATEELYSFEDREDTLAAFGYLKAHSKLRAAVKEYRAAERAKQDELTGKTVDADGVIA